MTDSPFKIYSASAGSGKTYTLTKEYLKIILSTPRSFGNILALTFTNKAVGEMKHRILSSLSEFGNTFNDDEANALFLEVKRELGLNMDTLRKRSKDTLKEILHNYAFFDISTIDKFTHRLIRTFAKDLKIPQNFEVVLDNELLLNEAVSRLLLKAGHDPLMTKVLIQFAFEKIDDDKSWDIALDLQKIGKLLFNENHAVHLDKLRGKGVMEFLELQKLLQAHIKKNAEKIVDKAKEVLNLLENNNLEFGDFTGGYFPKYVQKISGGDLNLDFDTSWRADFGNRPLYNKSCPEQTKVIIDRLMPSFIASFAFIKKHFYDVALLKNAYGNLVPLTVLNSLQEEVKRLQEERDQLSISDFNTLISKEIKDQPAPFIYERLGEKYRHYFIDEFQDTSTMQWENLIPLIGNALESQDDQGSIGSLFLVGDAKQAIYRWRGGKAEQFIDLITGQANPFTIPPKVAALPTNYRSHEEIVRFTNDFFTTTAPFLNNQLYEALFTKGNQQLSNAKKGGYVELVFIDEEDGEDKNILYGNTTVAILDQVLKKGYAFGDVCILVRNNREGVALADMLTQQQIPVVSSESLLLQSSEEVRFLVDLLRYQNQPDDLAIGYKVLSYLSKSKENRHEFMTAALSRVDAVLKSEYHYDLALMKQKSVYDSLELAIKQFSLNEASGAYLLFFMDAVLDVEQKEGTGIQTFLDYWEKKKDSLGLSAPAHLNAVQIMTVHKAKGLEFPIVIFPYANEYLYKRMEKKLWLPVDPAAYQGFDELLVNEKKEVLQYGETAQTQYIDEEHKMELDAFNVLYVALTRAEKALYIISKKQLDKKGAHNTDYYSGLFIHYLQEKGIWNSDQDHYGFGELQGTVTETLGMPKDISYSYTHKERPGFSILTTAGNLWDTERETALSRGNLVHHAMGLLETAADIDMVLQMLSRKGDVSHDELALLRTTIEQIVQHPKLAPYYQTSKRIINERDIMTAGGQVLRPDRLFFDGDKVTILDYKTGRKSTSYHQQLYEYGEALQAMGYLVENKIIIYIDETITPEFI